MTKRQHDHYRFLMDNPQVWNAAIVQYLLELASLPEVIK